MNQERALEVIAQLKDPLSEFLSMISGMHSDAPEYVGTGNFVSLGERAYLLTASHVVNEIVPDSDCESPRFEKGLVFTSNGEIHSTDLDWLLASSPLDIGATIVTKSIVDSSSQATLSLDCVERVEHDEEDLYFVIGMPGSGVRFSMLTKGLAGNAYPFGTGLRKTSRWENFDSRLHVAVSYSAANNTDEFGEITSTPNAGGLSGSILWKSNAAKNPDQWTPNAAVPVGVVHRYNQDDQCLICNKN